MLMAMGMTGCFQQKPVIEEQSSMHWLEDKSGKMTFDEILKQDLSTQWHKTKHRYPNFGFSKSTFWLSLPFEKQPGY